MAIYPTIDITGDVAERGGNSYGAVLDNLLLLLDFAQFHTGSVAEGEASNAAVHVAVTPAIIIFTKQGFSLVV
jgi:hypothetical protein